ncbi:hypothetical protein DFH07DRAFT_535246 [Mycena maculata]|uniref:Uncharacterized protein n=1 Tax=Mycena maculata TaxID=230809 RepID=A0AAD7K7W7_9AGAR|nr:hypothetical protein DFH07DRAFT_535246 [Mycena maculata]
MWLCLSGHASLSVSFTISATDSFFPWVIAALTPHSAQIYNIGCAGTIIVPHPYSGGLSNAHSRFTTNSSIF